MRQTQAIANGTKVSFRDAWKRQTVKGEVVGFGKFVSPLCSSESFWQYEIKIADGSVVRVHGDWIKA